MWGWAGALIDVSSSARRVSTAGAGARRRGVMRCSLSRLSLVGSRGGAGGRRRGGRGGLEDGPDPAALGGAAAVAVDPEAAGDAGEAVLVAEVLPVVADEHD